MNRVRNAILVCALGASCGGSNAGGSGSPVGSPCERSSDCEGTCVVPSADYPGGLCTVLCLDAPCPADSICLDVAGTALCLPECSSDADCRDGYGCGDGGACVPCSLVTDACVPAADADADGDANSSDEWEAEADADAGRLENGLPCTDHMQCRSRLCLPAALGGVCTASCAPGDRCVSPETCVPFARDGDGDTRTDRVGYGCVAYDGSAAYTGMTCSADADCRSLICRQDVCVELCIDDGDCDPMTTCESHTLPTDEGPATFPACAFTPVTTPQVVQVALPTQRMVAGADGRITRFWVPHNAVSLTIFGRQQGSVGGYVGVVDVYDPAGDHIYAYDDFIAGRGTPNWHVPNSRLGSFFVPITNAVTLHTGRYLYVPVFFPPDESTSITDDVDWTAVVKFDPGGATSGRLSANLFFINSDNVDASTAPASPRFQAALAEWQTIYASAGITVGNYTYNQITGTPATTYRVVDYDATDIDNGEVGEVMALSAGRTEWAVNVFLIHDFAGWSLLGIAGGVPGPYAVHGTTHSGVIVCLDCAWRWGGAAIGRLIAHEVGHYLGLFHSTENPDRALYPGDPLSDTRTGDTGNLMYWQAAGGRTLSAAQGWVIRRSPMVLPP